MIKRKEIKNMKEQRIDLVVAFLRFFLDFQRNPNPSALSIAIESFSSNFSIEE